MHHNNSPLLQSYVSVQQPAQTNTHKQPCVAPAKGNFSFGLAMLTHMLLLVYHK